MKSPTLSATAILAGLALGAGTAPAQKPGNGGLGNNAPRRLSTDYAPLPAGSYRPAAIPAYRPTPAAALAPRVLRGVADDTPPAKAGKSPAEPPAPAPPVPDHATDPAAPLGPQVTVEGSGAISPGPSPDNGANPYPAFYPQPIVGKKAEMAEAVAHNRANEPGWYKDWRCRQWGYYPTQWRAWPANWHEGRNLQPGPHPYDISPPELPELDENEPPPISKKLRSGKSAEKKAAPKDREKEREPDPLPRPKGSSAGQAKNGLLDALRDIPKKDAGKK